jgi:tRNA (uracil-5-)-methyltransferase TRM9
MLGTPVFVRCHAGMAWVYNILMDTATAARLLELNREFYTRFGDSFSTTRHRIQPGVRRVLESLKGDEDILDLGCGNGELARELAKIGHRGSYLGVDFSLPLLREAGSPPEETSQPEGFSARFMEADLTSKDLIAAIARSRETATRQSPRELEIASVASLLRNDMIDIVMCFAVLHHIPSREIRISILQTVHSLLKPVGRFIHSNWQFLNSEKLKARIQPWEVATIDGSEVDAGDYLLDWRSGGKGLRYVHHFSEEELGELAEASQFQVLESFTSDGENGRLGLYQVWAPV